MSIILPPLIKGSSENGNINSVAIIFLIVYVIGFPLSYAILLWTHRMDIKAGIMDTTWWFDFLFSDYRKRYYFFDLFMLLRRVLVAYFVYTTHARSEIHETSIPHEGAVSFHLISVLLLSSCFVTAVGPFNSLLAVVTEIVVCVSLVGSHLCLGYGSKLGYVFVWTPMFMLVVYMVSRAIKYVRKAHPESEEKS